MSREASSLSGATPRAAEELPLFELFEALRSAGLPLGTADYLGLLQALRLGEGLDDRAALLRLCQLLWTGSRDEARVLEHLFHSILDPTVGSRVPRAHSSAADAPPTSAPRPPGAPAPSGSGVAADEVDGPTPSARGRALELSLAMLRGAPDFVEPRGLRRAASGEYLPVSLRQMRQAWRRLRRLERRGPATEPDLDATLAQIARDGVLLGMTLVARRTNVERLLLFVDREGSMTPFQVIARRLADTARRGGRLAHVGVWHFHNTPLELEAGLAVHPEGSVIEVVALRDVLSAGPRQVTGALIFSDAGAARQRYATERIRATRRFLAELRSQLRGVAWLNPVPRGRWSGTSAQAIRALVPMFEADRAGVDEALRVLRGRRPHPQGAR